MMVGWKEKCLPNDRDP